MAWRRATARSTRWTARCARRWRRPIRELTDIRLVDYKVRILTPKDGTGAVTRVMIESADADGQRWTTVGVSPNIIDASFEALHAEHHLPAAQGRRARAWHRARDVGSGATMSKSKPPVVILVRPQLSENIGTAARAMLNCTLTEMRLVAPRHDWLSERAVAAIGRRCDPAQGPGVCHDRGSHRRSRTHLCDHRAQPVHGEAGDDAAPGGRADSARRRKRGWRPACCSGPSAPGSRTTMWLWPLSAAAAALRINLE